ncbi:lysophospholipid acyltransferase family protein [Candidatus Omnitrophota bacterium]
MGYYLLRLILLVILKAMFRLKVEGLENLPQKTNYIVVANHSSYLDPLALGVAIPKKIYWLTFRGLYNQPWLKWFLKATQTLPTGSASEKALYLLNRNKNVGIFPEGSRSHDGKLRDFRSGAALLAIKTGRPIVPCAIFGTHDALPKSAKLPRLNPIKVKIGRPRYLLKKYEDRIDDMDLQDGIFKVRNSIKEMINAG